MQGIQGFQYKVLLEYLSKLQALDFHDSTHEDLNEIIRCEHKLKEIYGSYQEAMGQVSIAIKQFEEHKLAIRRLVAHHKLNKALLKNRQDI